MKVMELSIRVTIVDNCSRWEAISATPPYFLDIIFNAFRKSEVHDKPDIRLINAKSKCNSGAHNPHLPSHPLLLDLNSFSLPHASVVRETTYFEFLAQFSASLISFIPARAIYNPTLVSESLPNCDTH